MIEPQSGVFVGSVSALVRDKLWEYICQNSRGGGCMMVYTMNNEQGFAVRFFGVTSRFLEDYDGLTLV
ncbi:MAG: type I-E CRISPR-associated endoribonuclease Cas2e, partial [Bacillota bacterium]